MPADEPALARRHAGVLVMAVVATPVLLVCTPAHAADPGAPTEAVAPLALAPPVAASRAWRLGLDLAYFGDLVTHPGALTRGQLTFGRGVHRLAVAAELGTYVHPGNDVGLFVGASIGYRVIAAFGLVGELSAGVGWLQTFLDGEVYQPSANQGLVRVSDAGRPAFMPSVSAAFGWDFSQRRVAPISVYVRPRVFWQYPHNTQWLLHGGLEVGVTYWFGR